MKKIMSIFSVVLFAFALTLSSCDESNADKASECSSGDDAAANVCANTGEACLSDHSCCVTEKEEEVSHTHGDEEHSHVGGDEDHSHDEVSHTHGDEEHSHEGGNEEHSHDEPKE